jgi:sugar phosphate isomerase/epimerase
LAFELTRDVLILASQIEAEAVIIHPGYRFTPWRNKPEQAKLFEEIQKTTYSELANESHKIGVPIFIENGNYYLSARNGERQPLHIGITPDELLQIAHIPSKSPFGICFDVGKAYFSSNNYSANEVVSYIERIAPLLSEVHLNTFSDYQNIIPLVLSSLEAINYSGPIVFECPKDNIKLLYKFFDRHNQA